GNRRALSGPLAAIERGQDIAERIHTGGDVGNGDAHPGRSLWRTGHGEQASLALDQQVIGLLPPRWSLGPIAGDATGDQPGMACSKRLGAEAEALEGAGRQILDDDVCAGEEALEHWLGQGVFDVEGEALLPAIEPDKIARESMHDVIVPAREIAGTRTFDL